MKVNLDLLSKAMLSTATIVFMLSSLLSLGTISFASSSNTVTANVAVSQTCNFGGVSNSVIGFGSVPPATTGSATNAVTVYDNGGNQAYTANVEGGIGNLLGSTNSVWIGSSTSNEFQITNTIWSVTSGGSTTALTNTLVASINIPVSTQASPITSNNIYFGLNVPAGAPADTYTTNIILGIGSGCTSNSGFASNTITGQVTVPGTCFISSVSNTLINFGSLAPGSNTLTSNAITVTDSAGNKPEGIVIFGGNGIIPEPFWVGTSAGNTIGISNTVWSTSYNAGWSGTATITNTVSGNTIVLAAPTIGTSTSNTLYLGMKVPAGTAADTYTTNIVLETSC